MRFITREKIQKGFVKKSFTCLRNKETLINSEVCFISISKNDVCFGCTCNCVLRSLLLDINSLIIMQLLQQCCVAACPFLNFILDCFLQNCANLSVDSFLLLHAGAILVS